MNSMQTFRLGIIPILTFMLLPVLLFAQNSNNNIEIAEEEIASQVLQQTGYSYHILAYKKVEREPSELGFDTSNPILDDIYIFVASAPRQDDGVLPDGFIGVYKNGSIIWQSEKDINTLVSVAFFTIGAIDINSDGRIEIITQWYQGMQGENTELWIYSWDGVSGERINLLDEEGRSQIRLQNYSIQLVDFEPDGIKEIIGVDWNDEPVAFQWNGMNYIKSTTTQPTPLPRNALDADISVQVDTSRNKFRYSFSVFNSNESLQSIEEIALRNLASAPTSVQKPKNWNFNAHLRNRLVSWDVKFFLEYHREALLTPGEEQDTLSFVSDGLPRPASFFMLGNNGDLITAKNQLINNSFTGYTLGPWLPDSSLNLIDFTDTLETFRFRSCEELEWATDVGVCEELEDDLSEVRSSLFSEDSVSAANALTEFIALVEEEKDISLTSEGYALLYFNAQYLAERFPEPEETGIGSGITCGCDNPVTVSSGTITLRNGETKCLSNSFSGSVFFESGGTLNVCSSAQFKNVYGNQPGRVNVSETGGVTVGNWNNNATEDAFTNWGSVTFTNWMTINNGSLINHGTMSVNGGLNQNNGPLVNTGELSITNSATFNQPGNRNEGTLSAGSLTLNSNAELINECRVESSGPVMINGDLIHQPGAFLRSENRLTVNSGGTLSMLGGQAMAQVNGVMLNGTIEHTGINLLVSSDTFNFNSGANIISITDPFFLVTPNLSEVSASFNVADGASLSIPPSSCNPTGYPTDQ